MTSRSISQLARQTARAFAALGIVVSLGALAGCGGASPLSPLNATLTSIAVTPAAPTIAPGAHQQFKATGTYGDATTRDLSSTVTWASATNATATISAAGLATGVAAGAALITATSGTIKGQATLTVKVGTAAPELVSIAVTPAAPTIGVGTKQRFTAIGIFADSSTQDLTDAATWTSATTAEATISATGEATGVAPGTTVITATRGTIKGQVTLTVTAGAGPMLVSIAVTPPSPMLNRGTKVQFTATGTFSDGSTLDLTTTVTWASSTPAIATISSGGEATCIRAGPTVISATSGMISGSTTLMVTMVPLVSIAVTPATPSIGKGTTQQFAATGTFVDASTQDLTSLVTWTSATPATATVSATGLADGVASGTTVISATLGAISGKTTLTVGGSILLVSIAVTPASPTMSKGTTMQFTATGFFVDGTTRDLTTMVTWASATAANATISNAAGTNGQATALAPGTTVISATSGTISSSTTLTIATVPLLSVAVTPTTPIVAKGSKVQFIATATFGDNTTQDVTSTAAWASTTTATATISNAAGSNGQATALAAGTTIISATIGGGLKGTTTLTVTSTPAKLVSIAVTPPSPAIGRLANLQFVATGTFDDATTQDLSASVTWASATAAVATISNAAGSNGLATPLSFGTTVISATSGAISGSTTLTVTTAHPVSITVTPVLPTIASGTKQQFVATAIFTDATLHDFTLMATWASATPGVATISNADGSRGEATALTVGTTVISATFGAVSGNTTLTVTAPAP